MMRIIPTRRTAIPVVAMMILSLLLLAVSWLGSSPVHAFRMAQYHHSIRRITSSPLLRPTLLILEPTTTTTTTTTAILPCPSSALTRMMSQSTKSSDGDEKSLVSSIAESVQVKTLDDETISLGQVLRQNNDRDASAAAPIVLSCLSHFGDFNAWELTQQYVTALQPGGKLAESSSAQVVLVGIGSVASAHQFAKDLELHGLIDAGRLTLVADPEGAVTDALQCYKGWLAVDPVHRERYPQTDVSPYMKLLGMIFGFGSPGTIEKVLYGYIGDTSGNKGVDGRAWVVDSLLQGSSKGRFPKLTSEAFQATPITSCLRPFELATLRLQTGWHIVQNWGKLVPQEEKATMTTTTTRTHVGDLLTRMGGTFVLDSSSDLACQWKYFDQGILNYADVDEVCQVVQAVSNGEEYVPWTKQEKAALNQQREQALLARQQLQPLKDESSVLPAAEPAAPALAPVEKVEKVEATPVSTRKVMPTSTFFAQPVEEIIEAPKPVPEESTDDGSSEKQDNAAAMGDVVETALPVTAESSESSENATEYSESAVMMEEEAAAVLQDSYLEELEDAIIDEFDNEAVDGLEAALEIADEVGDAAFEPQEDVPPPNTKESEESIRAKELFHRALLNAHLHYAARSAKKATSEPTAAKNMEPTNNPPTRFSPPLPKTKSAEEDQAAVATSTVEKEEDLFHRRLLQARYRYAATWSASSTPIYESSSPLMEEESLAVTLSEESKKEIFHRRMLEAQMNYKTSS